MIIGLIPARGGSKGIPGKNIKEIFLSLKTHFSDSSTAPRPRAGDPMVLSDYLEENGTVGHKIHRHRGARAARDTF